MKAVMPGRSWGEWQNRHFPVESQVWALIEKDAARFSAAHSRMGEMVIWANAECEVFR